MLEALIGWIFEVLHPSLSKVVAPAIVNVGGHGAARGAAAAIEKGDPARAERAMKDHLLYLRDVLGMVRERRRATAAGGGGG